MKTSDKFLIGILVVSIVALAGSTRALKAEHDRIDFRDPFYGFVSTPVKPFRVLVLDGYRRGTLSQEPPPVRMGPGVVPENTGDSYTTVGIQRGNSFEIRSRKDTKTPFTHRSAGDTLFIRFEGDFSPQRINADEAFAFTPFAYIIAPSLQQLTLLNTTCTVTGLSTGKLAITATGSRVLLSNSTLTELTALGQQGSLVQTAATNRITAASIICRDSASFAASRDVFGILTFQSDSSAILKVPAALLKKIR